MRKTEALHRGGFLRLDPRPFSSLGLAGMYRDHAGSAIAILTFSSHRGAPSGVKSAIVARRSGAKQMYSVGRPARRLVLCAAVCVMGTGPLRAQSMGTLRGHVYDDKGSPIAGATVLVSSRALGTAGQGAV